MDEPTEIANILDEASELLNRYQAAVPSTWGRNLEVLATLAIIHLEFQAPDATVGELIEELKVFLDASFRMGVESVS